MPVSIVVGGQFGSEGKGKVALELVRRDSSVVAAVRVGGTNSGHTAVDRFGTTRVLRQLPAAAADRNVEVILPPGSYIDVDIFKAEIQELGLSPENVFVSPMARVITSEHRAWESEAALGEGIGSTQSGTGASVIAAIARDAKNISLHSVAASDTNELSKYLRNTDDLLRAHLRAGRRIVIEGTQGFGLSVLHGGFWPKATSRDTTAAGFLAETGLSPLDVDDVTMVIRCHPIRVAGNSGPLASEIDWDSVVREGGLPEGFREFTTVTKRIRRIGRFDSVLVRRAILANNPSRVVLNHLDYIDADVRRGILSNKADNFVRAIEGKVGVSIDWVGVGPEKIVNRREPEARQMDPPQTTAYKCGLVQSVH